MDDLLPEQLDLLVALVDATHTVSSREFFRTSGPPIGPGPIRILHPGLPDGVVSPLASDFRALSQIRLIRFVQINLFEVTAQGLARYRALKEEQGSGIERLEASVRQFIDASAFRDLAPQAYARWARAESELWSADSGNSYTRIGHDCREALQAFATALVARFEPTDVESDVAKVNKRIGAVLAREIARLGETEATVLMRLGDVWEAVNDLVQRQEHGAQREKDELTWEDARRVVFMSAFVMTELARSLLRRL